MHFLSSIEIHLLKVTLIALSKYERENGAKKRVRFLASKVDFILNFPAEEKILSIDPVFSSWVMLSRSANHKSF